MRHPRLKVGVLHAALFEKIEAPKKQRGINTYCKATAHLAAW